MVQIHTAPLPGKELPLKEVPLKLLVGNMIEPRVIEVTGKFLGGLEKASEVSAWAKDNLNRVEEFRQGYDELIGLMNDVPGDSPLLAVMPETGKLKRLLDKQKLPLTEEMADGNFALALLEARGPMIYGQKIKQGEITQPSDEDRQYAIGTPSMATSIEALVVGTMGHLIERTFFQWARKHGFNPEGGWKKDDFLHALMEVTLFRLAQEKSLLLIDYFLHSNAEGGLGWLTLDKIDKFNNQLVQLEWGSATP